MNILNTLHTLNKKAIDDSLVAFNIEVGLYNDLRMIFYMCKWHHDTQDTIYTMFEHKFKLNNLHRPKVYLFAAQMLTQSIV